MSKVKKKTPKKEEVPKQRVDFTDDNDDEDEEVGSTDEALSATWRGLPLSYSPAAKAAAFRYGMNLIGLGEDDRHENGAYDGMADDAAIAIMCSLCSADAGKDEDCPEDLKNLLTRRTLTFKKNKLAESLMRFFDGFDLDPMDGELYEVGFELIAGGEAAPVPDEEETPGK